MREISIPQMLSDRALSVGLLTSKVQWTMKDSKIQVAYECKFNPETTAVEMTRFIMKLRKSDN